MKTLTDLSAALTRESDAPGTRLATGPRVPLPEYEQAASLVAAHSGADREGRAVVFSSAWSGEGTTTTALGVAQVLRDNYGARVLVVELNTGRPAFAERFHLDSSRNLTAIATGDCTVAGAIAQVGPGLAVLPAGNGAGDLLILMQRILAEARPSFDIVLVDAPPVLERCDALALAPVAALILVVEAGQTSLSSLQRVQERLRGSGMRLLGAVLNKEKPVLPSWLRRRLER